MAHLTENPTLRNFQDYLAEVCQERGWTKDSPSDKFVLFIEEVGELAKALRKKSGLYHEEAKAHQRAFVEEEFADVFSYLLDLANCHGVDLEAAFRAKEAVNESRTWK
jgi:NTP pyrophosphatase (non-canonical NTP hydrolase)